MASLKEQIADIVEQAMVDYVEGGYATMYAGTGLYGERAAQQILRLLKPHIQTMVKRVQVKQGSIK